MSSLAWFVTGPLVYFAIALAFVMTASTFLKYLNMPRHLRWDLYPIPHQGPEGSKYQKVDFHELQPHASLLHELKEMSQEMLFIKKIFINNPKVWVGTFPLHAGLYLGIFWLLLLILGAVLALIGLPASPNSDSILSVAVYYVTLFAGAGGFIAGFCGSLILLGLRIFDEDIHYISDAVSFINLFCMLFLFGTALLAWGLADPSFQGIRQHVLTLITFRPGTVREPLLVLQILAFCLFLMYLPFSRMMHFVGKYFFYHNIMWDDEMMKRGSAMENDIATYLQYKITWGAPHIRQEKSWGEQAGEEPPKEGGEK